MPPVSAETRILEAIARIPSGCVSAYGWVADMAGLSGRARLVARVLSGGTGEGVPWHRVLRSDGRIAFAPGSAAFREQARRLRAEGVSVRKGRADMARHGWRGDLDFLLWGAAQRGASENAEE